MGEVRTVLGDVAASSLGVVDYHEHLFQVSPLLVGDELDDEDLSAREAASLHDHGVDTMIEATPIGVGRRPSATARISAQTGLTIVHTTGRHHGGHYSADHPTRDLSEDDLTDEFVGEITDGIVESGRIAQTPTGAPVRAGLVKAAARYWSIDDFERRTLHAAGRTAASTGCAVMVHLEHGSAAHEVLDLLDDAGAPPARVVLAHIDRNLDPGLHADLAARGAYLGYDGPARHREAPDSAILDCIERVIAAAGAERIMLGGDVARSRRYLAYGGMPGLRYLPHSFLPRLRDRIDEDDFVAITRRNPARLLTLIGVSGPTRAVTHDN